MDAMLDRDWVQVRLATAESGEHAFGADIDADALVPAAVLVPLVERANALNVILTRRTDHLRAHAGQISFPGGRIERDDPSPVAAALREAEEEIGVPATAVELMGELPRYRTGTGFLVHPVVGFVDSRAPLVAEPSEVAEIFEVPLDFVLDPCNHRPHRLEHQGEVHRFCAMPYGDYYIWGATAAILRYLYRLLSGDTAAAIVPDE